MLRERKILIGVTGGIAAYKAAILVRALIKEGAQVQVIMTETAKEFITPLTLATLSKNPILVDFFDPEDGRWNSHISISEWADAFIIAPATANTIAKMAHGIADNLLLTTYLSARCPVFIAPAMDLDMYAHPATTENIATLQKRGLMTIDPGDGELASGLVGKGRMAEPEDIVKAVVSFFQKKKDLEGKRFIVTAGPTREKIDPVRYISNHSTGKMGYAIAEELAARGADVTLVTGPTQLQTPRNVKRIDVESAEDMYTVTKQTFDKNADGAVLCAAVADYTPAEPTDKKIKKDGNDLNLKLNKTIDIAAELGTIKNGRLLVGFALETDNEQQNAIRKLEVKNLDFIVLNSLNDKGAGFQTDTNKVTIIENNNNITEHPLRSKREVAEVICDKISEYINKK